MAMGITSLRILVLALRLPYAELISTVLWRQKSMLLLSTIASHHMTMV